MKSLTGSLTILSLVLGGALLVSSCRSESNQVGERTRPSISTFIKTQMDQGKKPNRLIDEKSPYLLQHAFNPVEWYPWGEEAFAKARAEQLPIFLSVGYATCHWCHVMERESFESDSIAAIMNKFFVCIKVDREERPDVDKVYMTALQGMGQNGGWPMSMFLTPDLKPFFGGTYFPPETRYGRAGFPEVLTRIHDVWEKEREKILESANGIITGLREIPAATGGKIEGGVLDTCYRQFERTYDPLFGGFGGGPKFPRPAVFDFLLHYHSRTREPKALMMVTKTLQKMALGGMYDHVGGGFHRYSVDREWRVPHFEKMLYDQAQLVQAYIDAFQVTKDPFYSAIAREVLDYVLRDMTHPDGGFYSAEDADSPKPEFPAEEGEGAFYVWTKTELLNVLGEDAAQAWCLYYGVEEGGNTPHDPQMEFTGKNILYVARSLKETATALGKTEGDVQSSLISSKQKLFAVRETRPRPRLDDKVICSWNGLMIGAFARAYQVLGDERYLQASRRGAEFVLNHLFDAPTKTLRRRYRDGESRYEAHLDDYAFLVRGLLDLYEASFEATWFVRAMELTQKQLSLFKDEKNGGFFDTSGKDPTILVRMKEQYDGAEPTGNSLAAMNLLRLARMTGDDELLQLAQQTIFQFGDVLMKQPVVMPAMTAACAFFLDPPRQIILAGRKEDPAMHKLLHEVHARYIPNKVVLLADGGEGQRQLTKYNSFLQSIVMVDGKATAYVCEDFICQLPTSDPSVVSQLLEK